MDTSNLLNELRIDRGDREDRGALNDYSLLGKKRRITNRLYKLKSAMPRAERAKLIREVKDLVNEIYTMSIRNGKKLINVDKVLRRNA